MSDGNTKYCLFLFRKIYCTHVSIICVNICGRHSRSQKPRINHLNGRCHNFYCWEFVCKPFRKHPLFQCQKRYSIKYNKACSFLRREDVLYLHLYFQCVISLKMVYVTFLFKRQKKAIESILIFSIIFQINRSWRIISFD